MLRVLTYAVAVHAVLIALFSVQGDGRCKRVVVTSKVALKKLQASKTASKTASKAASKGKRVAWSPLRSP
jgi:hypothetical protein